MIVIVEKNENGKIELTKEELQKLLEEATAEGENEARKRPLEGFNSFYNPFKITPTCISQQNEKLNSEEIKLKQSSAKRPLRNKHK